MLPVTCRPQVPGWPLSCRARLVGLLGSGCHEICPTAVTQALTMDAMAGCEFEWPLAWPWPTPLSALTPTHPWLTADQLCVSAVQSLTKLKVGVVVTQGLTVPSHTQHIHNFIFGRIEQVSHPPMSSAAKFNVHLTII